MLSLPRNVWILTACQSLFMSLSVFMVFVAGIIGSELAPTKSLSTLPVATIVVGTALSVIPVIRLMSIFGRKKVFLSVKFFVIFVKNALSRRKIKKEKIRWNCGGLVIRICEVTWDFVLYLREDLETSGGSERENF